MKTISFLIALCVWQCTAYARNNFKIICEACNYERETFSGNSKMASIKTGISYREFFCSTKKDFLSLPESSSTPKDKKIEIVKVKILKDKKMYSHSLCKGSLTPLEQYQNTNAPCPICGKGKLQIFQGAVID